MKKKNDFLQWVIGIGDLLIINGVFFILYSLLPDLYISFFEGQLKQAFLLLNFCYFFSLIIVPMKLHGTIVYLERIVVRSFYFVTVLFLTFGVCLIFLNGSEQSSTFITLFYVSLLVIFSLYRILVRLTLKYLRRKGIDTRNVIIIGAGKNGLELEEIMSNELAYGYKLLGFFDDNLELKKSLPNYLGMTWEVEDYVEKNQVDEIYCTLPGSQDEKILRFLNFAEKNMIRFFIVPEFYRNVKKSLTFDILETVPVLTIRKEPLQFPFNRILKRMFDIIFSIFVLIVIFPWLYLIVALLIKTTSKGPVFFKQKRTGMYGQDFLCYKFRTMSLNKESDIKQAEKNDPRVTKIGAFLRKTNIDEFPQFINVLKGEMSVVGPRPHMLKHTEIYSSLIDKYMVRHLVKPGLTGWAQVTGFRGETKTVAQMEGRVKRDVWYIENWSFFLDIKIVLLTAWNMFKGEKNAY